MHLPSYIVGGPHIPQGIRLKGIRNLSPKTDCLGEKDYQADDL